MESSNRQSAATDNSLPSSETAEIILQVTADAFANATLRVPEARGRVNSQSSPEK